MSGGLRKFLAPLPLGLLALLLPTVAYATISVQSPTANTSITAPVHFAASATPVSTYPITALQVYVDSQLLYTLNSKAIDVFLPLAIGTHTIVFKAWDTSGAFQLLTQNNTVRYGVSVASPSAGESVTSPLHISAQANAATTIVAMAVYVDDVLKVRNSYATVDSTLALTAGQHNVVIQAWDSAMPQNVYKESRMVNVMTTRPTLNARDQFLQAKFQAGVTHIDGRYGFTTNNFLLEGGSAIRSLGAHGIFVYLYPQFRTSYPDKSMVMWPSTDPTTLTQLAQTTPYKQLFAMNYDVFVLTTFTFTNSDNILNFNTDATAAAREEQEIYDLAKYLLNTYKGTGKTFILKNWETDEFALQGNYAVNISSNWLSALDSWFEARQRGVTRARNDAGNPAGIAVFHAVEVSRVLDYVDHGLIRTTNAILPVVNPDMVTYSSYDSTLAGTDSTSLTSVMNTALNTIKRFAPDLNFLRSRRILISEYGLFENELPTETTWRATTILRDARAAGLSGAFLWQLYDNECKESDGSYYPVDSTFGTTPYPADSDCEGLWLRKPDGTYSTVLSIASPYW
jgi:hypothetical protein